MPAPSLTGAPPSRVPSSQLRKVKSSRSVSNYADLERLAKKHSAQFHEITAFFAGVDKAGGARVDDGDTMVAIKRAYDLRKKYQATPTLAEQVAVHRAQSGEAVEGSADLGSPVSSPLLDSFTMPPYAEFVADLQSLQALVASGPVHSACHARLRLLEEKFELHKIANGSLEGQANQFDDMDFYSIKKADVCNQLASGMSAQKLLNFVREKLDGEEKNLEVLPGRTLKELFDELGITAGNVTLDKLGVQAPDDEWGGDLHDEEMSSGLLPTELSELHTIFLSHSNHLRGAWFADIVRGVVAKRVENGVLFEPRVPVCGLRQEEMEVLAEWATREDLLHDNVMWAVQIPARSWSRGRAALESPDPAASSLSCSGTEPPGHVAAPFHTASGRRGSKGRRMSGEPLLGQQLLTFRDLLDNIFGPVMAASRSPGEHPKLARFLARVGVFAVAGDERTEVAPDTKASTLPEHWYSSEEPPYHWQMYYVALELSKINNVRREKGMNTFNLRPVAGEGFEASVSLMASYLLSQGVTNCVRLVKMPPLEYLFYLWQIGITLSFIGANRFHTPFHRNPLLTHFRRGLNVCLCTGEPLRTHSTNNMLLEEYSLFQKTFQLSSTDISEMARCSVLQSNFPHECKCKALGDTYWHPGSEGNNPDLTNVADMRLVFRGKALATELSKVLGQDLERRDESWQPSDRDAAVTEPHSFTRVRVTNLHVLRDSQEKQMAAEMIRDAVELRFKYVPRKSLEERVRDEEQLVGALGSAELAPLLAGRGEVQMVDGVLTLTNRQGETLLEYIRHNEFLDDYNWLLEMCKRSNVLLLSEARIKTLLTTFQIHKSMNSSVEAKSTGDFYSCAKVDNHIHMAAGMSSKELLEFIQDRVRKTGDDIVSFKSNKTQTLDEVYRSLGIDINSLTVDDLDVMADSDQLFHRFDRFNDKYNPLGSPALRECFLKTDNFMAGRYFAELCKRVLDRVANDGYYTELRLSIYGRKDDEWDKLARWAVDNNVERDCNRWLIQVPRIYHIFRKGKMVSNFGQVLRNVFGPLWQVSVDPRSNWKLHMFLKSVAGFDSVDNEKITDAPWTDETPLPDDWDSEQNPPYAYWLYYMYANIQTLNQFRRERGLTTFTLRPHCGESGAPQHLAVAFLVADGINHGINLRKSMPLQYLYYLTQLPVSCSPLSNNALFLPLQKNPFPQLFNAGLNITLSTDDPLQFHLTQESLIEEYSIAAKLWKHTTTDLVEMARNSVLMSGLPYPRKALALGPLFMMSSSNGNQRYKSRLSDIRVSFRYEALDQECRLLGQLAGTGFPRCISSKEEEEALITRFALSGSLSSLLQPDCEPQQQREVTRCGSGSNAARRLGKGVGASASVRGSVPNSPAMSPAPPRRQSAQQQYAAYYSQHDSRKQAWSSPSAAGSSPRDSRGHTCITFVSAQSEAVIMRTRTVLEGSGEGQRWESLRRAVSRVITEELPEYGGQGLAVMSRDRTLLRQWDRCIDNEGEVVVRLTPHKRVLPVSSVTAAER
eukprot:TRINITY_DN39403_c0_g1_i1.p1 TRINITY_DN39403_c0_g1~~TRINITY_DN39403_c0_g1_i1.p1  ORF type:complete len:1511 (+),score=647.38 TRINITY_DN39403_c0_g1_i1:55-4587(+)